MRVCPIKADVTVFRRVRVVLGLGAGGWLLCAAGCAHYETAPLVVDRAAAGLEARTLDNAELRRYLAANLGRDFSAVTTEWDFEALVWVAFYYNPSLDVARAQWAAAQAGVVTAGARTNPALTFTPGFNSNAEKGVSPWMPAVNFDFLLDTAARRQQRTALARFAMESSRQAVLVAAWQVRAELRRALNEWALAEARGTQLGRQAALQRRLAELLEQRLAAGAMARREVMAAQALARKAEAAVEEAARQVPLARLRVAQALGVPVAAITELSFAGPAAVALTSEQIAVARRAALQARADVLVALARFEASQMALEQEVTKRNSAVHLGPGYQWDQGANKWTLALTLELPLFHRNEGPITEAVARRQEAAAVFNATQAQALAEIDGAVARRRAAVAQVVSVRQMQSQLERQTALVQARLQAGGADRSDLATAQLEQAAGDLALVEAQAVAAGAAGDLEAALQVPFGNFAALAPVTSKP